MLPEFHRRLSAVLDTLALDAEIVYVNDGSSDGSLRLLAALHGQDRRVAVIDLSRNFGKEAAMSAGLDFAEGDAVVLIDADLQDPPELIEQMLHQDPRPGYMDRYPQRDAFFMRLYDLEIRWTLKDGVARVTSVVRAPEAGAGPHP